MAKNGAAGESFLETDVARILIMQKLGKAHGPYFSHGYFVREVAIFQG